MLNNIFQKEMRKDAAIPIYFTPIKISGTEDLIKKDFSDSGKTLPKANNQLLSLHPFIQKHYFSKHQHSFFYSDEKITD